MTGFYHWASEYIARKIKVIPLKPGQKDPATKRGHLDASRNWDQIERWSQQFDDQCNIGIVGGIDSGQGGLFILDVDAHKGGLAAWQALIEKHGRLNHQPPVSLTPSGGLHMFFACHPEARTTVDVVAQGIDTKVKGYVVAPCSRWIGDGTPDRPGGDYRWFDEKQSIDALGRLQLPPAWLIEALAKPEPVGVISGPQKQLQHDDPTLDQWEIALVHIPNTERDTWWKIGASLKAAYGDAAFDVWDAWSARGYDKYNRGECMRIWRSFRGQGHGFGTLFHFAKDAGFNFNEWNDHG